MKKGNKFIVFLLVITGVAIYSSAKNGGNGIPFPEVTLTDEDLENKYYYSSLDSEQEQLTYKEVYEGLMARSDEIYVHECGQLITSKIVGFVEKDFPEIFWIDGKIEATISFDKQWGTEYAIITPEYRYTLEEISGMKQEIDNCTQKCLQSCEEMESDYEKVKYISEYLIDTVEYKANNHDQNIYSALVMGETVCAGYTKGLQYLLENVDVECYSVDGIPKNQEEEVGHTWNIVNCDGNYYYVDVTWADTDAEKQEHQTLIKYDYICFSESVLQETHKEYNVFDPGFFPECNSEDLNYYRLNDMFYDDFQYDEVLAAMKESISQKEDYTVLKFANKEDYENAVENIKGKLLDDALQYQLNYYRMYQNSCNYNYSDELKKIEIFWQYE